MKTNILIGLFILVLHNALFAQINVDREKVLSKRGVAEQRSIDLFPVEPGIGKVRVRLVNQPNTASLRLHFRIESAPPTRSWAIQVKDSSGNIASVISANDVIGTDFWSNDIPGASATVELITIAEDDPARPLQIKIVKIVKSSPPFQPESITPPNQLETIANQSGEIKNIGKAVVRLRFIGDDGGDYLCSGFMISRDLLMTNNHCIKTNSEMISALIDFDYDEVGAKQSGSRLKELILTNSDLDFSLLRLRDPIGPDRGFLKLAAVKPSTKQSLIIVQHPGGEPKQVSRQDCIVENPEMTGISPQNTDFSHLCDTRGGSSGSPVIDNSSQIFLVVGIHHLGFDPSSSSLVNRAVRMGLILEEIRSKKPSILSELGIQ